MHTGNETQAAASTESSENPGKVAWWEKPVNVISFGWWGKRTPGEKQAAFVSWNVSSWFTLGQVAGGSWLWSKMSAAAPWLGPFLKGVWTKVTVACSAFMHAVSHT